MVNLSILEARNKIALYVALIGAWSLSFGFHGAILLHQFNVYSLICVLISIGFAFYDAIKVGDFVETLFPKDRVHLETLPFLHDARYTMQILADNCIEFDAVVTSGVTEIYVKEEDFEKAKEIV